MSTAATPSGDGAAVERNGRRYIVVTEGLANILVPDTPSDPKAAGGKAQRNDQLVQQVFYNPIQQFNRDLSVLVIRAHGRETLEKKAQAAARRKELQDSKKRKRQERKSDPSNRPQKVGKLSTADGSEGMGTGGASAAEPGLEPVAPAQETPAVKAEGDQAAEDAQSTAEPGAADAAVTNGAPKANGITLKILDALSASGLRALRYARELPFTVKVTANDLLPTAVETIKLNVEHNGLADSINVSQMDAKAHMYTLVGHNFVNGPGPRGPASSYDVIDLDPYGTAAPFLDAAVQAVRADGGLLCVTCTDAGVWASNGYQEKAFALYGGIPAKGPHSHEAGIRIILHSIAASAARYGLAMEPLLSLSIDFYCRVFVRIRASPASVKFLAGNTMLTYGCDAGCGAWTTQLLLRNTAVPAHGGSGTYYKHTAARGPSTDSACEHCGHKMHVAGPMYAGRIHSAEFVRRVLDDLPQVSTEIYKTTERIRGMLQTALEEVEEEPAGDVQDPGPSPASKDNVDPRPFFVLPQALAKVLHCRTPGDKAVRGALRRLGYRVTRSHCKPGSIKTDAPWSVIWQVMREWVRQEAPVKEDQFKPGMPGYNLLKLGPDPPEATGLPGGPADTGSRVADPNAPAALEVVFDEELGRESSAPKGKLVRYQTNPREHWGPMSKAKGR